MYDFDAELEDLLTRIREYYPRFTLRRENLVREAYEFGKRAHADQKRFSGEPYFMHPVEATKILLAINPDIDTIIASLLHDVIEDTNITAEEIGKIFGEKVQFLCDGVAKVSKVQLKNSDRNQKQFDSIQKLFIAMGRDIRVIFVKVADRIHNLRTLEHVRDDKQRRIARESLEIYAPVAEKFGLFEFKTEIEDLCFKVLHPDEFNHLEREMSESRHERQKYLEQARREILKAMRHEKFELEDLSGREKHLYSVFQKMKRKNFNSLTQVHDIIGLRVIVPTRDDCYRVLGIFHSHWRPIPGRFKDYISVPKPNGYQSLHTTVLGLGQSKLPTEIQIRTKQMHLDAEYGPASHWAYKQARTSNFDPEYVQRISWMPQMTQEQFSQLTPEEFFKEISDSIFSERIYVFTPKGDIRFLPKGATPVDFAFSVHSEVGEQCMGAMVDGAIKPLDYELRNGQVVKVLTRKGHQPNPQWLSFVRSNSARHKIQSFVNRSQGEDTGVPAPSSQMPATKPPIKKLSGGGPATVDPAQISKMAGWQMVIGGVLDLPYRVAPCCASVPGSSLVAYANRGTKFSVHHAACPELNRLDEDRMYDAYFQTSAVVEVQSLRRHGFLRDLTAAVADSGAQIVDMHQLDGWEVDGVLQTRWEIELVVRGENDLAGIEYAIGKIDGVSEVLRKKFAI